MLSAFKHRKKQKVIKGKKIIKRKVSSNKDLPESGRVAPAEGSSLPLLHPLPPPGIPENRKSVSIITHNTHITRNRGIGSLHGKQNLPN